MKHNGIWNFRIPTLLGLFLVLIGVACTSWVANHNTKLFVQADSSIVPENIRVTNISDTSFSVSFSTRKKTIGAIAYGIDSTVNKLAFDDRNTPKTTPFFMHHITIRNLQPQSKYFFMISVDGKQFLNNNAYFETTTAPKIALSKTMTNPIHGKVAFPDSFEETIIYVTNENSQAFSSLVQPDGTYTLPLSTLRTRDLLTFFMLPDDEILQMLLISPSHQSVVTITGREKSTIPLILLSESYDFTQDPKPLVLSVFDDKTSLPLQKFKNKKVIKSFNTLKRKSNLSPQITQIPL